MSAISITPGSVLPSAQAALSRFFASAAITAGQPVYLDNNGQAAPVDGDGAAPAYQCIGLAVDNAVAGQPLFVATRDPAFTLGGTVAAGEVVITSATTGALCLASDAIAGWKVTVLGVGIGSNKINLFPVSSCRSDTSAGAALPTGVSVLLNPGDAPSAGNLSSANVDVICIGDRWCNIETSEGLFSWGDIDTNIAAVAAAGKKVLLRFATGRTFQTQGGSIPDWVATSMGINPATTTTSVGKTISFNGEALIVFFNSIYAARKRAFIAAAGDHFTNHPAIRIINVSICNGVTEDWSFVDDSAPGLTAWTAAGYTTQTMLDLATKSDNTGFIDVTAAHFPNQNIILPIGRGLTSLDQTASNNAGYASAAFYLPYQVCTDALAKYGSQFVPAKNSFSLAMGAAPGTGIHTVFYNFHLAGHAIWGQNEAAYNNAANAIAAADVAVTYGISGLEVYKNDAANLPTYLAYLHGLLA